MEIPTDTDTNNVERFGIYLLSLALGWRERILIPILNQLSYLINVAVIVSARSVRRLLSLATQYT